MWLLERSKYKLDFHELAEVEVFPNQMFLHVRGKKFYAYVEEEGYYKVIDEAVLRGMMAKWCKEYEVPEVEDNKPTGKMLRPYNTPLHVGTIWSHFINHCGVATDAFNPPGHFNATNGVVGD